MILSVEKPRYSVRTVASFAGITNETVQGIADCSKSAFQTDRGERAKNVLGQIERGGTVYLVECDGVVQAFATSLIGTPSELLTSDSKADTSLVSEADVPGVYLGEAAVRKELQGQGIYKTLTRFRVGEAVRNKLPLLFVTTQNPRVIAGIKHAVWHYGERGYIESAEVKAVGFAFLGPGELVTRERQFSRSQEANDLFNLIDVENGDGYLFFVKLTCPGVSASLETPSRAE